MIKAKKSLGQNFLTSKKIAREIAEAGNLNNDDTVIEIGPGKGMLTNFLLEKAGQVIALEKDVRLIDFLKEKYKKEIATKKFILEETDALLFQNYPKNYKLIANIPYYITGAVLKKFLESKCPPTKIILLVQKEVGERIVARDKKESILSISVKAYGEPDIVRKVQKEFFSPKPKVDSVILRIDRVSKDFFKDIDEKEFFKLVKTGFKHKRKTLVNNIKKYDQNMGVKLQSCGLESKIRAEKLSREDWKCLLK